MNVNLVQFSVSHYLLARGLEQRELTEKDLKVVNTSDADIAAAFNTDEVKSVTTWNPMLAEIKAKPGVTEVFDSSQIPGEIMDMMVVNTQTLKDNPALGKALTGAWFEVVALMNAKNAASTAALEHMAKASGTDLANFQSQLDTTRLFATAEGSAGIRQQPETAGDHGQGRELFLRPRPARRRGEKRGHRGYRLRQGRQHR